MKDTRFREVTFNADGDLVWYGHDLGPSVGILDPGATEYEFWRFVRARHVRALASAMGVMRPRLPEAVLARFTSDVQLDAFAGEHGIPTEFASWMSNWNDPPDAASADEPA